MCWVGIKVKSGDSRCRSDQRFKLSCAKAVNMMKSAAKSFKSFKVCLDKRLAYGGFTNRGNISWRKCHNTIIVIEVQKDRKYSTQEEIRFSINVGISIDALRSVTTSANSLSPSSIDILDIPAPEKCHWRQRLGRLLPAQSDVWWSVHNEQTSQVVCDEIATGLIDVALPKIEALASSEALVNSWQQNYGQGLTEFERRNYLATLLVALGRNEEALKAIQMLEQASLGKSWAVSAAYDIKELRKQLA